MLSTKYKPEPAEVYWPDNGDAAGCSKIQDLIQLPERPDAGIVRRFGSSVRASADLYTSINSEVNMDIRIGGCMGPLERTLMGAQLVGFVDSTLPFTSKASPSSSSAVNHTEWTCCTI